MTTPVGTRPIKTPSFPPVELWQSYRRQTPPLYHVSGTVITDILPARACVPNPKSIYQYIALCAVAGTAPGNERTAWGNVAEQQHIFQHVLRKPFSSIPKNDPASFYPINLRARRTPALHSQIFVPSLHRPCNRQHDVPVRRVRCGTRYGRDQVVRASR